MGTTLSTTVGWGFSLTAEDVEKLDRLMYDADDDKDEYENFEEYRDDQMGEGVWYTLRDFKNWEDGASHYYEYGPDIEDGKYYVYLKRLTNTFYGAGFRDWPDDDPWIALSKDEAEEFAKLMDLLGRQIQWYRFVETSIG